MNVAKFIAVDRTSDVTRFNLGNLDTASVFIGRDSALRCPRRPPARGTGAQSSARDAGVRWFRSLNADGDAAAETVSKLVAADVSPL